MNDYANSESVSSVNVTDDREARSKFWVAVYTRPRSEKKVVCMLKDCSIEAYLPLQKQLRQWSDRKKLVDVAVIPMILFVLVSSDQVAMLRKHPLIINVLTSPGSCEVAHIPVDQIERLKFILGQSDTNISFTSGPFKVKDKVRVRRGYFIGIEGIVHECEDGTTDLIVVVDLLGGVKVKIDKSDLEVI